MALSLKTISVGSETGVQDIQSNFTTIKSAVDALQDGTPTITKISDYTCLNGVNATEHEPIIMLNYQTYQILCINMWLNNINLSNAWQSKTILSIPKSYIRFRNKLNLSVGAPEYWDNGGIVSLEIELSTGQIVVFNRNKAINNTRITQMILIYD